jgi:hypothetical protein
MQEVQQYQALLAIGGIRGSRGEARSTVDLKLAHSPSARRGQQLLDLMQFFISDVAERRQFLHLHLTRQQ